MTIDPGVQVLVDGPYRIDVLSTITAIGSFDAPIRFAARAPGGCWRGLRFEDTPPTSNLTHCVIEDADDSGVTLINSIPVLRRCVFRNNSKSGSGGGLSARIGSGDLVLEDCDFVRNEATSAGGAIYADMGDGTLRLERGWIRHNRAGPPVGGFGTGTGGGIFVNGSSNVFGVRMNDNAAYSRQTGSSAVARGGALYSTSGDAVIANSLVIGNDARGSFHYTGVSGDAFGRRGGVYLAGRSLAVDNSVVACNTTNAGGGGSCCNTTEGAGVYVASGTGALTNVTVARNDDRGAHGQHGALRLAGGTSDELVPTDRQRPRLDRCGQTESTQPRYFRIGCEDANSCEYEITHSENDSIVPVGSTVNVRAEPSTTEWPVLEETSLYDWAFDPDQAHACSADPVSLVEGEWTLTGGPVTTPEPVFADCWARCPADGGDL